MGRWRPAALALPSRSSTGASSCPAAVVDGCCRDINNNEYLTKTRRRISNFSNLDCSRSCRFRSVQRHFISSTFIAVGEAQAKRALQHGLGQPRLHAKQPRADDAPAAAPGGLEGDALCSAPLRSLRTLTSDVDHREPATGLLKTRPFWWT